MFRDIELWDFPVRELRSRMDFVCEMTAYDHSFLCGMIKMKNPKKVVEIGVAEGGTTAVIVNRVSLLDGGAKREVYSVDLNDMLFYDKEKKTGYEYNRLRTYISETDVVHQMLLGETIAKQIEKIGADIDFVIIDTTHRLPGEILDFLCVLPYLAKEATVVLHDMNLNYMKVESGNRENIVHSAQYIVTKVLFSAVAADKYLSITEDNLANIGAFTISSDTFRHVESLFYLLSLTWGYMPQKKMLDDYRSVYAKHYDKECLELYDIAVKNNQKMLGMLELAENVFEENLNKYRFPYHIVPDGSKVILYGAGAAGREIYVTQKRKGKYEIVLWVDKKFEECMKEGLEVESPEHMLDVEFDYIVVAVERENIFQSIYQEIISSGWDKGKPVLGPISGF